jgi:hypothetical protein
VEWPRWEDAAFYMQEPEVMYASMAAQRRGAPVYWYEPKNFVTGLWVLSKWEHQRFVGSHPELFSNQYGAAIGDASEPSTVMRLVLDVCSGFAARRAATANLVQTMAHLGDETYRLRADRTGRPEA